MSDERSVVHLRDEKRSTRAVDRWISELAETQYGVVERRQLMRLGVRRGEIDARIDRGVLHPLHRGVYAMGHRLVGVDGRWLAAVLACGPGTVLSHRSAGQLWRLMTRSVGSPEVTRTRGWRAPEGVVSRRSSLASDELDRVRGIPVTSAPRTLLDLAAVLSKHQLERAANEAEMLGLTDSLSLPDLIARYPRRRGTANLRALFDARMPGGITRSELEERFVVLIDAHGLPRPRLNAHLAIRGRFFEVDCLWRERRLVVELDGRASHGTGRAFEEDRERDRLLLVEGWQVVRITWRQIHDDPVAVIADLRRLLRPELPHPAGC
jgi:very-short-patch-repair endonuclease